MSGRMKLIFTLSVILNVLLLGAAGGMAYQLQRGPDVPGDMSPQARDFMRKTFKEGRGEIAPLIDEVKRKRAAVEDILLAPEFDEKAYDAAANDMLDTRDKVSRKRAEIMGRALVGQPIEDRRDYARRILDGLEGRPKPPHHHRPGTGPDENTSFPQPASKTP